MRATSVVLLVGLLLSPALPLRWQNRGKIQQVEIRSTSTGWASTKALLLIERQGDSYRMDGEIVDAALVQALARALAEPVNAQLTLADLGITPEWLRVNASIFTRGDIATHPASSPEQEALFERIFTDPAVVEAALPGIYRSWHTDDNPSVEVAVTFEDGTTVSASSRSQHAFVLPWQLKRDGGSATAYNADISRAVVALMPEKLAKRTRLAGKGLASELASSLMWQAMARTKASDAKPPGSGNR